MIDNEWQVNEIQLAVTAADSAKLEQFVDNDTVMKWMDSWNNEHEIEPPL